jgi:hypothetical protein
LVDFDNNILTCVDKLFLLFLGLYIPEFNSFTTNCVNDEPHLNGTFLSRNFYDLAYNYASSDGNGQLTKGIENYNSQVSEMCSNQYSSSLVQLHSDLNEFTKINESIRVTLYYN